MWVTKDSGERQDFPTGARRDTATNKPQFENIPAWELYRLARRYGNPDFDVKIEHKVPDLTDPAYSPDPDVKATVRPDLVPEYAQHRLEALYGRGERKYGANNWTKGINLMRTFGSLLRHAFYWYWGDTSEDHLAAVAWNAYSLMWTEREIYEGRLPAELGDAGWIKHEINGSKVQRRS